MGQLRLLGGFALGVGFFAALPAAVAQTVLCDCENIYGSTATTSATLGDSGSSTDVPAPRAKSKSKIDPYAINGYDDGAFQLKPTLGIGTVYTNNAALSPTARVSDVGLELKPTLTFQSEWPRHDWHGSVGVDWQHYLNTPSANILTGAADTSFRLDIRRDTYADFAANYAVTSSTAGSQEVPGNAAEPRRNTSFGSAMGITHDFGPMQANMKVAAARYAYSDVALVGGGTEINSDRNYWEPSLSLRGGLGTNGSRLKPYVELTYDPRLHDQALDRNGQRRNSQGFGAALGVSLDDGPIWTGDISANFIARSYDDPALKTAMALGVNGSITWSPTSLLNVVATTSVALNDSEQLNISATPTWTASLNGTYTLRDNVNLRAGGSASFSGNGTGIDTTLVASAGADWLLNPNLSLSGTLQSTWYNAAAVASRYDEQRAVLSVVVKP